MRMHAAVWLFAETNGNDYARACAAKRKTFPAEVKKVKDSNWIKRSGGVRLRRMWTALTIDDRRRLMEQTPDDTFPPGTEGILDERTRLAIDGEPTGGSDHISDTNVLPTSTIYPELQSKLIRLQRAQANFHEVVGKECMLRLDAHYNEGSLSGVIDSTVTWVQHAVLLSRARDRPGTAAEAYESIARRLTDVFRFALGTTRLSP
ncbi:hypothetical protein PHYSODRAFT_378231, partial [Phytophthora sojae]